MDRRARLVVFVVVVMTILATLAFAVHSAPLAAVELPPPLNDTTTTSVPAPEPSPPPPPPAPVVETTRQLGQRMAADVGWLGTQWGCLERLWTRESGWRVDASNGRTWGIPQALPGRKMASSGADWRTNPVTQIHWGIHYIGGRYRLPCSAWSHFQRRNWY